MKVSIKQIQDGTVTTPKGFLAGGTYAGIKTSVEDALDLGILYSEVPAAVAGVFTTSKVVSPSVIVSRKRVSSGAARAVVANSGCANCCVGDYGRRDAEEMTSLAAKHVGVSGDEVLVCSTGLIGVELPMALVRQNIGNIELSTEGGNAFARSILTTDSRTKQSGVSLNISGTDITIGGAAKGVGMIHPNMATMLAFITTDANVEHGLLQQALKAAADVSFNMIDVDGDQSTNDTVLVLANGASGGDMIEPGSSSAKQFEQALVHICTALAKDLVRDGEGAQKLIEVTVDQAQSVIEARNAAREIASSVLVKSMVHGQDPNWGRIMMALGKSDAQFEESGVDVFINEIHVVHGGVAISYLKESVISAMSAPDVRFKINLNAGEASATSWSCDLTEEYVTFNSAYST